MPSTPPGRWSRNLPARAARHHDPRNDAAECRRVIAKRANAVCVFNLGHGKSAYRLIAAIHFNTQTVFVLRLLTHAEYDKQEWKSEL